MANEMFPMGQRPTTSGGPTFDELMGGLTIPFPAPLAVRQGPSTLESMVFNPNFDSTVTLKSPAGSTAIQTPGGGNQVATAPGGQQAPGQGGINPQLLGVISFASDIARSLLGGDYTALGSMAGVTSQFSKNMLFNQFLQNLQQQGKGGGQPTVPFNPAL